MKIKWPGTRRLLKWIAVILAVLIVLLYVVLPFAFGFFATLPRHADAGAPPEGFEDVTLTTVDGVRLAAWYAPPQNGAVIVLLPGSGDSRKDVRDHAALLTEHGFGVLAVDLRGHGESGGDMNRFGWQGTQDVGAAVAFLQGRSEVRALGGLGLSLGGEVLLGAASAYPALQAIVSDGATYRSYQESRALPDRPFLERLTSRILYASVRLFSGDRPPLPILESLRAAAGTRFLFIAAGREPDESAYGRVFVEAAGDRGRLWTVDGAGHTQGLRRAPDAYAQQVIGFFEAALKP